MSSKPKEDAEIQKLLPLRVSNDLTVDEAERVDQHVRYNESSRKALASYKRCVDVLRDAGGEPLPVDDCPSLWARVEPRLGPAGRQRRRHLSWIPTWQLAAACVALLGVVIFQSVGPAPVGQHGPVIQGPQLTPVDLELLKPLLGVVAQPVSRQVAERLNLRSLAGAYVTEVMPGSQAQQAGLRKGDIILRANNAEILSPTDLAAYISQCSPGEAVDFMLIRDGQWIHKIVRLGARQSSFIPEKFEPFPESRLPEHDKLLPGSGSPLGSLHERRFA